MLEIDQPLVRLPRSVIQALAVLVAMGRLGSERPLTTATLAKTTGVSMNTLEELAQPLRRAGLVRSIRGRTGGYVLCKPLAEMSVREVIKALSAPADEAQQPWERVTQRIDALTSDILTRTKVSDLQPEA